MSNVKTYYKSKSGNINITPNFKVKEFCCNDGTNQVLIDYELVSILQLLRDILGKPLYVNSGYRTPSYNKKVGGATNSYHIKGQAFDISGFESIDKFCNLCNTLFVKGIIKYQSFVHIDTRQNQYHADNQGVLLRYSNERIPYFQELLKVGSKGYKVAVLQHILNAKGYNCGTVDGIFGSKTYSSVLKLQKDLGFTGSDIDGIYGVQTHNRLFN